MSRMVKTEISTLSQEEQVEWPLSTEKVIDKYEALAQKLPSISSDDFDDVYKHPLVMKLLRKDFSDKCAYCQSHLDFATGYFPVEHYRPKTAYIPNNLSHKTKPGYWWLAYDWNNLLLACQVCNLKKGSHFPLSDESQRDISNKSIDNETPLILNPIEDDFNEHIVFVWEVAMPQKGSVKGAKTIELLDLNREELLNSRRDALIDYFGTEPLYESIMQSELNDEAKSILKELMAIANEVKRRQHAAKHFDCMFDNLLGTNQNMSF